MKRMFTKKWPPNTTRVSKIRLVCRNYEEARIAFEMAVKFGKEIKRILWQLSHLKVQTRDYDGFAESRRLLMVIKPNKYHQLRFYLLIRQLPNSPRSVWLYRASHLWGRQIERSETIRAQRNLLIQSSCPWVDVRIQESYQIHVKKVSRQDYFRRC